jgi:hypothetical protein
MRAVIRCPFAHKRARGELHLGSVVSPTLGMEEKDRNILMSRTALTLTAVTSLTLFAGVANANTNAFPECIASPNELGVNHIASQMFKLMPFEQQKQIAHLGGIGSENFDHAQCEHDAQLAGDAGFEHRDMSIREYRDQIVTEELEARLTQGQINIINEITNSIEEGKILPHLCFAPGTDLEFAYAVNQLIEYPLQFTFQQTSRWSRTATDGSGLTQGEPTTITYSFVADGTFIPNAGLGLGSGNSVLFSWLNGIYGNPATWQSLFDQVFDRWSELTGLSYVHETNDDGANTNGPAGILGVRGDVRIGAYNFSNDGNFGVLAYNNFPNDGDMIFDAFDSYYNGTGQNSRGFRNVISHEHGHGLGMLHVCPIQQTKLMEPFATNAFDGPQLDDILLGHRHYGDPTEPNNDLPDAIDMGNLDATDFWALDNLSIDDNSDIDILKFNLTERAKLNVLVGHQAAQYQSGPQTFNCNTGALIDYRAIHDLEFDLFAASDLFNPIASTNNGGAGSIDSLIIDLEDAGLYYLIISAATNTNNVQRYQITAFTQELPPIECPADLTGDGILDFFDVSAFLSAYNTMNPDADFNNDGIFNFFDVSAFLNEYNAGCP